MFKRGIIALAAGASVIGAVAPAAADARVYHHYRHHVYHGSNARYYCHRGHGTTGAIVGAGAGALLGAAVTHGAAGPIAGAVGGGLLGRHIARHSVHCR